MRCLRKQPIVRYSTSSDVESGLVRWAALSSDGKYRYWLVRRWCDLFEARRTVTFLMLNPSTADAEKDDPTIRRCMGFARAWDYDRLLVLNLFALRATNPAELQTAADPIGPANDVFLRRMDAESNLIIAAWGAQVPFDRDKQVCRILEGRPLFCLGTTKGGFPRHPLYCRKGIKPVPWRMPT